LQGNEKTPIEKYEVSPLELLFDLVFVLAVSLLERHIISLIKALATSVLRPMLKESLLVIYAEIICLLGEYAL